MMGALRRSRRCRRCLEVAVPAAALLLATGCATPDTMRRSLDDSHRIISRGLADVVDAADRAFGEPRVEDRERIVQLRFGPVVRVREGDGADLSFPVRLRVPLPALERRANIFLQFDSFTEQYGSFGDFASELGDNKSFTATILSKIADNTHAGSRIDLYWNKGPNAGVRPFLRYETRPDHLRFLVEQQFYARTDDLLGGLTVLHLDRIFSDTSFLRFLAEAGYNMQTSGVDLEPALLFRRPFFWWDAALSVDLGLRYNPYRGDPETGDRDPERDPDEVYAQLRVIGKIILPWIEYEIKPGYYYLWRHEEKGTFAVTCSLRFIYEDFLRGE